MYIHVLYIYIYMYIYICFILFPLLYYNYSFIYLYKGYASFIHISRGYVKHKMLRTTGLENVGASTSHNPMGSHCLLQG
jgi:hypothetical protein